MDSRQASLLIALQKLRTNISISLRVWKINQKVGLGRTIPDFFKRFGFRREMSLRMFSVADLAVLLLLMVITTLTEDQPRFTDEDLATRKNLDQHSEN